MPAVVAALAIAPLSLFGMAPGVPMFAVMLTAIFAGATAPPLIALVSASLGGESQLGIAIAALCVPCAIGAALFFYQAIRFFRRADDHA